MKVNEKKKQQLGSDPGTLASRLKKTILFSYIKKASENFCYQCGAEIDSEEELSIEHKVPWLDSENPKELFFSLENIAFSHLNCNIRAARRATDRSHPSYAAYRAGCRCSECTVLNNEKNIRYKKKKKG